MNYSEFSEKSFLHNAVRLCIVDDDRYILDSLADLFFSPLFSVHTADSTPSALKKLTYGTWHCCLLDIAMEHEESGLDVLRACKQFPFVIMLSGLRSMQIAGAAMEQGAMKVFDKEPDNFDTLHSEVCRTAALGFILGGKQSQYLQHFMILKESIVYTPEQWADTACMTVRQLERICKTNTNLSPRFVLPFYYALSILLETGDTPSDIHSRLSSGKGGNAFFRESLDFCLRNCDKFPALPV